MFAALSIEREPLSFHDILPLGLSWLEDAGGFATVVLGLWLLFQFVQRWLTPAQAKDPRHRRIFLVMGVCFICAIVGDVVYWGASIREYFLVSSVTPTSVPAGIVEKISKLRNTENISLRVAGIFAIFAISLPLLFDLVQLKVKARRVWALARLSMKEAVRRKVLWVFVSILVVFLFGSWFIEYSKPEDQVRSYVKVLDFPMTWLLLLTAALLAAFSIPGDIKQQTIHTILTKPVERFEIVLGRFLGYTLIMTAVLVVMTALSLGYLLRGINPYAEYESLKARVPLYGKLIFQEQLPDNRYIDKEQGTNVGREWDYRSYIAGPNPPQNPEYAVWNFDEIPSELAQRDQVRCEFAFDIYRTTKGVDNKGVQCTFTLETWRFEHQKQLEDVKLKYQNALSEAEKNPSFDREKTVNELAAQYGYYELSGKNVVDFHTLDLNVPGGLFKNALGDEETRRKSQAQGRSGPLVRLRVHCDDATQYVGVAKHDLYFRVDDPDSKWNTLWFAWNFFKGAFGLWLRLCLVIGLSITFSTYLSGVISFLLMGFLYVGGMFQEYIQSLANPTAGDGGGPMESFVRLIGRENAATPLEGNTQKVVTIYDEFFRWFIRRVLNILPPVERFDLSSFVSEGFNISTTDLVLYTLLLIGFLVPLAILAYHLLRWREVASAT